MSLYDPADYEDIHNLNFVCSFCGHENLERDGRRYLLSTNAVVECEECDETLHISLEER